MPGMLAFALIFGFVLTGCEPEAKEEPQKIITITGLNSYLNKYAVVGLTTNSDVVAMSQGTRITSSSASMPLLKYPDASKWTGTGTYTLILLIYDNLSATSPSWSGGVPSVSITSETTTLSFSSLISIPVSNMMNIDNTGFDARVHQALKNMLK